MLRPPAPSGAGGLRGKAAVVTGGSRGIGRAVVERLAGDGAVVVFNYQRDEAAAYKVEQAVAGAGGAAFAVQADLGRPDGVPRLLAAAEEHLEGLDILVNNAAVNEPARLAELPEEQFDRTMTVNAKAVFLTMRYAAGRLRDNGRIINISTLNTSRPAPGVAAYAASKAAVEQLTAVAAAELGERGITVNSVVPGAVDTDLLRETNSPEALARVAQLTPLGRLGEPADVAAVVAFFAGPDSRWVTGQRLHVTGGFG